MPRLTIHLVRHGETAWNAESRLQGWTDVPLNTRGREQAQEAAAALAARPIRQVISSDLLRARQTAEPIAVRAGVPLEIDAALRERGYGAAEGRSAAELAEELGDEFDDHWMDPDYRFEGGESRREVYARLGAFLGGLLLSEPSGELVLVSHGGALRAARGFLEGMSVERLPDWQFHNGQITTLTLDPHAALRISRSGVSGN